MTLTVLMKKVMAFLICVLLMTTSISFNCFAQPDSNDAPEGYEYAASSDQITLYFNQSKAAIAVKDNRSGYIWYSNLQESEYPADGVTDAIKNEFNSLLLIRYSEMNIIDSKEKSIPIMALNPQVTASKVPQGIQFSFNIESLSLKISVDFVVEDDGITVKIPKNYIEEAIGTDKAIQQNLADVYSFIEYMNKEIKALKNDNSVSSKHKRDVVPLEKKMKAFENKAKSIRNAMGIESTANNLLRDLDEIQSLYVGSANKPGIFNLIQLDKSISSNTKNKYKKVLTYIEDQMTLARISVGSLKTITVGGVISISVMPYFGAAGDESEGYVLYPDGSGALTHFKKKHSDYSFGYNTDIYSDDTPNIDWEEAKYDAGIRNTYLPVFGIRKNGAAFVSNIEQGDANAMVSFYPSGYIVDVNRSYFSLVYRRKLTRDKEAGTLSQGSGQSYEEKRRDIDFSVRYMFLDKQNADYSGMVNRLREQMLSDGRLKKSSKMTSDMPVGIELLGGVEQTVMIYKDFINMTTFSQAEKMISELSGYDQTQLFINYRGWAKSGFGKFPTGLAPADKLGGKPGLKSLSALAKKAGAILMLGENFIEAEAGQKGYNNGDLALSNNLRPIASTLSLKWLISPKIIKDKLSRYVSELNSYGVGGVSFDRIGTFVYYDYSTDKDRRMDRQDTASVWGQALSRSQKTMGASAVTGGNSYTFSNVDWIIKAPTGSSEYVFTDESIPFYQMLIHGVIPYSLKPGNNFYDAQLEKLTMIEYGGIPYFTLAYDEATKLQDLTINMFVSKYDDVKNMIDSTIKEFAENFGEISDKYLIAHQRINEELVYLVYSDGTKIFINYSKEKVTYEGNVIDPMNYLVIGKHRSVAYEQKVSYNETQGKSSRIPIYIAVVVGILGVLCISFVLFRHSRIKPNHRPADKRA